MKSASIPGYFTNHSLRATATTRLYDAQVDEATIMERTGHRSVKGVRAYKRSIDKLRELSSSVLNCEGGKIMQSSVAGTIVCAGEVLLMPVWKKIMQIRDLDKLYLK